ncbi:hypothetical protein BH10PSE12_BH10PSE12_20360 [soil metagenome]
MPVSRRIKRAAFVGVLSFLPLWAVQAGDRESARAAMTRGLVALDGGDPRTARVEFMNALKDDPDWADARIAQARALLQTGEGVGAQAELERARKLHSPPGRTRALMAHALLAQGEADAALKEARAMDVSADQRAYALRIAGRAHMMLAQMAPAGQALDQALALNPRDAATWIDIGRFRRANGDQAGAIVAAGAAVGFAPRSTEALILRAILIRDQYGLAAALPWFDRALAIDPNDMPALDAYAASLADMGQARRMLGLTRRMLALEPRNPRAFFMQAVMAARAGNYALARTLLGRTGGALDGSPAMMLLRGILYIEGHSPDLAVDQLGALNRMQPDNQRAQALLGRALFDDGRFVQAATVLAPLAARGDANSYALTLAARVEEALGHRPAAAALLNRATTPNREDAETYFSGGGSADALAGAAMTDPAAAAPNIAYIRALLASGQIDPALARAQGLLTANRGAPAAYVIWGDALTAAHRGTDAAQAYEKAADLDFSQSTALRLVAAWRGAGRPDRAAQVLGLYLGQNPRDVAANRIAASAWLDARAWDRAVALLEPLRATLGDNDVLLMADLAWGWLGKGDTGRALAYAAHAYRLQPASPVAADVYGWVMLKKGWQGRNAVDLLEKAVALAPGHPMLARHLRDAYAATGLKPEA